MMKTNANQSKRVQLNMVRLTVAAIALLALTVQVVAPAFAQSADSFLPPEVVPLDPQVAAQLSQAQAKARELNPVNRGLNVSADPVSDAAMNNASAMNAAGAMSSRGMRQDMMQSLMTPGTNGAQVANMNGGMNPVANAAPMGAPASTGTSDWIMPEKQSAQGGVATNYGNVDQTQTLTGQAQQQGVRHNTSRGGASNAVSAMAGLGAGAFLGSILRRPGSLTGVGMTGLMFYGLGSRNAFAY